MESDETLINLNKKAPDLLFNQCIHLLVDNINVISTEDQVSKRRILNDDIHLPSTICEQFLEVYQKTKRLTDDICFLFNDVDRTGLTKIKIFNCKLTNAGFLCLMQHKPVYLELKNCNFVTKKTMNVIYQHCENLKYLKFLNIHFQHATDRMKLSRQNDWYNINSIEISHPRGMVTLPLFIPKHSLNLTYLDMSYYAPKHITLIKRLHSLDTLILFNVQPCKDIIEWICQMRTLKKLDLSHSNESSGAYVNPNDVLSRLVTSLPHLTHLDISGTNLAGSGASVIDGGNVCDIPGLVTRVKRPLEFLGLYKTSQSACTRHDIPAREISGDGNEKQILIAASAYFWRPSLLHHVINDIIYLILKQERVPYMGQVLRIVLNAMETYKNNKHIHIVGNAALYYIVRHIEKTNVGLHLKRRIIKVIMDGMEAHEQDSPVLRNGFLTLTQFKFPKDVLHEYERMVQILLDTITTCDERNTQKTAVALLNSLACHVSGTMKQFLGEEEGLSTMLWLIEQRIDSTEYDNILEIAWSTLWNMTDETPKNCKQFLDRGGIRYFLYCMKYFPYCEDLLRSMLGLMGNVAEVAQLRPVLMYRPFVYALHRILKYSDYDDGFEILYNAAGVLANMLADGPEAWTVSRPSRPRMLNLLYDVIEGWNLRNERNINYRSLRPILALLRVTHTPLCQIWASFALANLTFVSPNKYCKLFIDEGGLDIVHQVLQSVQNVDVLLHSRILVQNCSSYMVQAVIEEPEEENMDI
ncbi:unnamed protein product [Leptidea sinapis]|uniref:Uncharacterized protein n=1 Tax=Leptidea sinapis TaxID=189913 RepID=A0A5E4QX78_9NEOP|nr:unnamed protein product [Leptidea sinapis]